MRKKAAFSDILGFAVERVYFATNPLAGVRRQAPQSTEGVDPECVPSSAQVSRLLDTVDGLVGRGPHLKAFYGCLYYAAMRPAEASRLELSQCDLPKTGWGC